MPERDDHKEIARAALAARALAMAERWFRRADQLDYVVRRWLMPIPFGEGARSTPHKEASIRRGGLSSDIQAAMGRASAHCTPSSDPCPLGSLIFSENLSNEVIGLKHLPETVMQARLE